jgi:predicted RNA-binding Zn ribbon-like protein
VLAVPSLIGDRSWSRLRVCANGSCRKVCYDTTRSRTQRWHSYEVCGTVAAYRARNAAG